MRFDTCVRHNLIDNTEKHLCFFCGQEGPESNKCNFCPKCGQWVCPECGKCYCSGTEQEKKLIRKVYSEYCCNVSRLLEFSSLESKVSIVKHVNSALRFCSSRLLKLNVGCGSDLKKGYLNIDVQDVVIPEGHQFSKMDFRNMPEVLSNSVAEIYANQVIEHIHPLEISEVLYEWRRVLMPGGVLRIIYPDFDRIIELYQVCKDLDKSEDVFNYLRVNYATLCTQMEHLSRGVIPHKSLVTKRFLSLLLSGDGFRVDSATDTEHDPVSMEIVASKILLD